MRRKIVLLTSWYPSALSPVSGVFIQEQARLLAERYDVTVIVSHVYGVRAALRGSDRPRVERDGDLLVYHESVPVPPYNAQLHTLGHIAAAWRGIDRFVRERGRPDLLHAHVVLPCGWVAAQASRRLGISALLTEHSGPFTVHLRTRLQRRMVRATIVTLRVLAVSPALRSHILEFAPGADVRVLGNVVATRFFTPGECSADDASRATMRFLTIALLVEGKGIQYLLEAVARLIAHGASPFELVIGGDGPDRQRLEAIVRDRGLEDHCRFVGLLDRTQVRHWMRWCDAFILPSLHETFGIVLGEAMACGKPVITTRCGGPEYVVDNNCGVLVPPGDPAALADAMDAFLTGRIRFDPSLVRNSIVERFGEEAFLRNIAAIYEEFWACNS